MSMSPISYVQSLALFVSFQSQSSWLNVEFYTQNNPSSPVNLQAAEGPPQLWQALTSDLFRHSWHATVHAVPLWVVQGKFRRIHLTPCFVIFIFWEVPMFSRRVIMMFSVANTCVQQLLGLLRPSRPSNESPFPMTRCWRMWSSGFMTVTVEFSAFFQLLRSLTVRPHLIHITAIPDITLPFNKTQCKRAVIGILL